MRLKGWIKALPAGALAVTLALAVFCSLGATNDSARFHALSHRLMCTCGCAEILGECNHVGCTESTTENAELKAYIAKGLTDQQIMDAFAGKYGMTVLAAPPTKGFDLVAWIAPFAVFAAALLGTFLLIRRWSGLSSGAARNAAAAPAADAATEALREKIRRETDPGSNGGF